MVRIVAITLLSALFFGTSAFAADAVDGTWKLNVAKSKFRGTAPKSATRVYTESADGTTLDQKMVGADGKEMSMHVTLTYDGKDHPMTGNPDADSGSGKALDAHTSDFTLKRGGKRVGRWQDAHCQQQGHAHRRQSVRRYAGLRQAIGPRTAVAGARATRAPFALSVIERAGFHFASRRPAP